MVVHKGTKVVVDGKESVVASWHASGKHTQTALTDGRVITDLEKSIANGVASVVEAKTEEPIETDWSRERGSRKKGSEG